VELLLVLALAGPPWATGDPRVAPGKEIFQTACAQCHGGDGRGNPDWESKVRPVDFTDCSNTGEPTEHWESIVKQGGKSAGLASVMPAFGEAFSADEIGAVVAYLRTLCATADNYPPGDLNFRRPLQTGKAFPEQEIVLSFSHRPESGNKETELEMSVENRIGPRFQYEITLPARVQAAPGDGRGFADLELEAKQVVAFDPRKQQILSLGLTAVLPTGNESKSLSSGTTVLSPFLAFGKGFSRGRTFIQSRLEMAVPTNADKANTAFNYALALSRALGAPRHAFTPAVELTGSYDTHTKVNDYSTWVEVSKPLNALGHIVASVGVQIPVRPKSDTYRIQAFLLWDFGDGAPWIGW
jgi:mono/diheme cytochrome c family protein